MTPTLLIPAAAYIQPNMQTEFGRIPPCFLPLSTGVLLDEQVKAAAQEDFQRVLSLPPDFELEDWQRERVEAYGFDVVRPPAGLSLGQSVLFALNAAPQPAGRLRILHGDTLLVDADQSQSDTISVHRPESAGYWAYFGAPGEGRLEEEFQEDTRGPILSGYFDFAEGRSFLQALALEEGDFVHAVSAYGRAHRLHRSEAGRWYDFGRLETYFLSRRAFTSERHFNDLSFTDVSVRKQSAQRAKMRAERQWYEALPDPLKLYTPTLLSTFDEEAASGYEIEYLAQCSLSELFVFSALPLYQWRRIARSAARFLAQCRRYEGGRTDARALYADKTHARLSAYCEAVGLSLDEPFTLNGEAVGTLRQATDDALALAAPREASAIMHGDFCFSNILFDARLGLIRTIDPRGGIDVDAPSIYGDPDYDVAKLYHSFAGGYDLIVAGRYDLSGAGPYDVRFAVHRTTRQGRVAELFVEALTEEGLPTGVRPRAMMVLLFLSMLPLHADRPDRQRAFLANALLHTKEIRAARA